MTLSESYARSDRIFLTSVASEPREDTETSRTLRRAQLEHHSEHAKRELAKVNSEKAPRHTYQVEAMRCVPCMDEKLPAETRKDGRGRMQVRVQAAGGALNAGALKMDRGNDASARTRGPNQQLA